jgi:Fur family transcriptional regulator, ferric uptake regulator
MKLEREIAHEEFKKFLKRGDGRITLERFEVLDYAMGYDGHFGADELYVKMRSNLANVSRATVYNTLELLAQSELLSKRNFGENKTLYESNIGKSTHGHLICTTCGAIKEFSNSRIQSIVKQISGEIGFEVSGYSFNIFGKCNNPECGQNKNG